MANILDSMAARVAGQLAQEGLKNRFAAQTRYETAPVAGSGLVRIDGQLVPAMTGEDEMGTTMSMTNVGRPAMAIYAPQGGNVTVQSSAGGSTSSVGTHVHSHNNLSGITTDQHHPQIHGIVSTDHSATGLTAGNVLRATAPTTFNFSQLQHSEIGGVSANQHHNQVHGITSTDHTITGLKWVIPGATADNTLGLLTPLSDVTGITKEAILKSDPSGYLSLAKLTTPSIDSTTGQSLTIAPALDLYLSPVGNDIITADAAALRSSNFLKTFPMAGYRIGPTLLAGQSSVEAGSAEFDELRARIFVADETRVDRGQEYITKSYGILSRSFITPQNAEGTASIYFENSPHIAGRIFTTGDWIMLRYLDMSSGIILTSVWGTVSDYYTTDLTGEQRWTFTFKYGTGGLGFGKGAMAVNFGASGQGYILSDAVTATAPSITIGKWTTNPYTPANVQLLTAVGRLDAVGLTGEWGLAAAVSAYGTNDQWLKVSSTGAVLNNLPLSMTSGGVEKIHIAAWNDVWIGTDSNNQKLSWDGTTLTIRGTVYLPSGDPIETMRWRGAWTSGVVYAKQDAVSHLSKSWITDTAHTASGANPPGTGAIWAILADQGATGAKGDTGVSVTIQYSVNGSTSWHNTFTAGDIYMHQSTDGGSNWSDAIRIVGEHGDLGDTGPTGNFVQYVFARAASIPTTPSGNGVPSGWYDGPPAGTDILWMSNALQTAAGVLVGSWSTPARLTGDTGLTGADNQDFPFLAEDVAHMAGKDAGLYMVNNYVGFWNGTTSFNSYINNHGDFMFSSEGANPANGATRLAYVANYIEHYNPNGTLRDKEDPLNPPARIPDPIDVGGRLGGQVLVNSNLININDPTAGWRTTWHADAATGTLYAGMGSEVLLNDYGLSMIGYTGTEISPLYNTKAISFFEDAATALVNEDMAHARIWGGWDVDADAAGSSWTAKSMLQMEIGVGNNGRIDSTDRPHISMMYSPDGASSHMSRWFEIKGFNWVEISAIQDAPDWGTIFLQAPNITAYGTLYPLQILPHASGSKNVGSAIMPFEDIYVKNLHATTMFVPAFEGQNTVGVQLRIGGGNLNHDDGIVSNRIGPWVLVRDDSDFFSGATPERMTPDATGWYTITFSLESTTATDPDMWLEVTGARIPLWRTKAIGGHGLLTGNAYLTAGDYICAFVETSGKTTIVARMSMVRSGTQGGTPSNGTWITNGNVEIQANLSSQTSVTIKNVTGSALAIPIRLVVQGDVQATTFNGIDLSTLQVKVDNSISGAAVFDEFLTLTAATNTYATISYVNSLINSGAGSTTTIHGNLLGLTTGDDHSQYVHLSAARTITGQHTFAPASALAPFLLGTNARGQLVVGFNADTLDGHHWSEVVTSPADILASLVTVDGAGSGVDADFLDGLQGASYALAATTLTAGDGLAGGGTLGSSSLGISLAIPGTLTATTTNTATGNHVHTIDSTIARSAITLTAGAGLTGGGDWTTNRSIAIDFDTTNPAALGTAGPGIATVAAHRDHVHTMPKLDDTAAPDDNTDLNATTSTHGLLLKAVAPATLTMNIVGIINGETIWTTKTLYDNSNPEALGTMGPGTSLYAAHRDHVHTMPKLDDTAAPDDNTDLNATTSAHGLLLKAVAPAADTINVVGIINGETAYTNKTLFDTSVVSTSHVASSATAGTSLYAAHRDHVHAITTSSNVNGASILASDANGALSLVTLTATTKAITPLIEASALLTLKPTTNVVLDPTGKYALPGGNNDISLGDLARRWKTLHVTELMANTLVKAAVTVSMQGRMLFVAASSSLIADVTVGATTIDVKESVFVNGDHILFETSPGGTPQYEIMSVTSSSTPVTGGYRYTVTRNADGTGADAWLIGDVCLSTGSAAGHGYIDLIAAKTGQSTYGPSIVTYARTGTAWDAVKPVTIQGNLRSFVDYGGNNSFGFATGNDLTLSPSTGFNGITLDRTNGIRIFGADIQMYDSGTEVTSLNRTEGLTFANGVAEGGVSIQGYEQIFNSHAYSAITWKSAMTDYYPHTEIFAGISSTYEDLFAINMTNHNFTYELAATLAFKSTAAHHTYSFWQVVGETTYTTMTIYDNQGLAFKISERSSASTLQSFYFTHAGKFSIQEPNPSYTLQTPQLGVINNTNGETWAVVSNSSTGLVAATRVIVTSSTASVHLAAFGGGSIPVRYGVNCAGWSSLETASGGGLLVGTHNNATPIVFGTNDLERMRILSGGNVGVGTNTPVSLFSVVGGLETTGGVLTIGTNEPTVVVGDVLGRINFYAPLEADGSDAILTGASIVAVAEDTFSSTVNKTSLQFQTGASETATTKMTLLSSGNLGIGTTAPVSKVSIKATDQTAAGFATGGLLISNNDATYDSQGLTLGVSATNSYSWIQGSRAGYSDALGILVLQGNGGNIGIGTNDPLGNVEIMGQISTSTPANLLTLARPYNASIAYQSAASFKIYNPASGTTNSAMSIDLLGSNQNHNVLPDVTVMTLFSNTTVGIGTTSGVDSTLTIYNETGSHIKLARNDNWEDGQSEINIDFTVYNWPLARINSYFANSANSGSGGLRLWYRENGVVKEGLRVEHTGRVGIGSTGAGAKLTVASTTTNLMNIDGKTVGWYNVGSSDVIFNLGDDSNTQEVMRFRKPTTSANDVVTYFNGKVGVGTTAPNGTLHVKNAAAGENQLLQLEYGGATNDAALISYTYANTVIGQLKHKRIGGGDYNLSLLNWNGSSLAEMVTIKSTGNVGIGTATPEQLLSVAVSDAQQCAMLLLQPNHVGWRIGMSASSHFLQFNNTSTDFSTQSAMVIDNANGNVSIQGAQIQNPRFIPQTGGSSGWVKLGTLTIPQQGYSALVRIITNGGYNASIAQNCEVIIRFKTSNAGSVDAYGFAGDSSWYSTGRADIGGVKWVANAAGINATAYDLYVSLNTYTGGGGFYTVESSGTWVHNPSVGNSDPGGSSSTILVSGREFNVNTNALVVTSTRVGIGTNGPSASLHIQQASDSAAYGLYITRANGTRTAGFYHNSSALVFHENGSDGIWQSGTSGGVVGDWTCSNAYMYYNCSALSFTDRPGSYDGNAISDIAAIQKTNRGTLAHETMPKQTLVDTRHEKKNAKGQKVIEISQERNITYTIDMLLMATQELIAQNAALQARIDTLETLLN